MPTRCPAGATTRRGIRGRRSWLTCQDVGSGPRCANTQTVVRAAPRVAARRNHRSAAAPAVLGAAALVVQVLQWSDALVRVSCRRVCRVFAACSRRLARLRFLCHAPIRWPRRAPWRPRHRARSRPTSIVSALATLATASPRAFDFPRQLMPMLDVFSPGALVYLAVGWAELSRLASWEPLLGACGPRPADPTHGDHGDGDGEGVCSALYSSLSAPTVLLPRTRLRTASPSSSRALSSSFFFATDRARHASCGALPCAGMRCSSPALATSSTSSYTSSVKPIR